MVLLVVDLVGQREPGVLQRGVHVHPLVHAVGQQLADEVAALAAQARPPLLVVPLPLGGERGLNEGWSWKKIQIWPRCEPGERERKVHIDALVSAVSAAS